MYVCVLHLAFGVSPSYQDRVEKKKVESSQRGEMGLRANFLALYTLFFFFSVKLSAFVHFEGSGWYGQNWPLPLYLSIKCECELQFKQTNKNKERRGQRASARTSPALFLSFFLSGLLALYTHIRKRP